MARDGAVIVAGVRTPIGAMGGSAGLGPAPRLGAACIKALLERDGRAGRAGRRGDHGQRGLGRGRPEPGPAGGDLRRACPPSVGATTVNKVCGSGLKAVMLADQAIRLGDAGLVVAGGMESMSRAPYLLTKAREGYRMGNGELIDAMIHDGLWDVYGGQSMGTYGDRCAERFGFTRQEQDDFAVRSHTRARKAIERRGLRRRDRARRGRRPGQDDAGQRPTRARAGSTRPSSAPSSRRSTPRGRSPPATRRASTTAPRPC